MTPAQVYTQIRNQCNESADSSGLWTESEILRHMSDGENIIAQKIGCTEDKTSFTTGDGTREYGIGGTGIGTIFRLTWDSVRLQRIDLNQIDDYEGSAYGGVDWSGKPEYYYLWDSTVGFSPIPDSTKTAEIYHYAAPSAISSTSQTAWTIPDRYGQYITNYALSQMFIKDQQMNNEAALYEQKWKDGLVEIQHDYSQYKFMDQYPTVRAVEGIFTD